MIEGLKCKDCMYSTLNTHGKIVCLLPNCVVEDSKKVGK